MGAVGTVSFVALDRIVENRIGRKVGHREAAMLEIQEAKRLSRGSGAIAINVMVLVKKSYQLSVEGAIDGGADIIIAGAGLPMDLPEIVGDAKVALVPIVSSGRALQAICRRWDRDKRMPDAVVLEGPLAGGHLGFKAEDVAKPEFQLENIFGPVKAVAEAHGGFPVVVAGGIYSHEDILRWVQAGADGVQIGTRFAATKESGASEEFKRAIVAVRAEDIEVAVNPGSPSGLPFRVIKTSPGYQEALARNRPLRCTKGYLLHPGQDGRMTCLALQGYDSFCICDGLFSAIGMDPDSLPIFTVGTNAARVDRVLSVQQLMDELTGVTK